MAVSGWWNFIHSEPGDLPATSNTVCFVWFCLMQCVPVRITKQILVDWLINLWNFSVFQQVSISGLKYVQMISQISVPWCH